ncbi:MAG: GNAT family N-acetyltransferase [Verrucomicrobiota bacterium]
MKIRRYRESDREALTHVWLRSVQATHHFLSAEDIAEFLPLVQREPWLEMETWILESRDQVVGFMSLTKDKIEGLFLAPEYFRQGWGRQLVERAKRRRKCLSVDVNEQNKGACAFYTACGFIACGKSATDNLGKPFPLIHMKLENAPGQRQRTQIQPKRRSG